jgi:alkylation response protein AidB-like acyl-CoA dehydrogenase
VRQHRTQARHQGEPDAVLQFGDGGGATGYLVGQENHGLEYMFIMMNAARYAVGIQGIAVAESGVPEGLPRSRASASSRDRSMARCRAADPSSTTPTSGAC